MRANFCSVLGPGQDLSLSQVSSVGQTAWDRGWARWDGPGTREGGTHSS